MNALNYKPLDFGDYKASQSQIKGDVATATKSNNGDKNSEIKKYFSFGAVCSHFERNLRRVHDGLNDLTIACNEVAKFETSNEVIDAVYEYFDDLEDYVEFICDDFADFEKEMKRVHPNKADIFKEAIPRLNSLTHLFAGVNQQVARQKTDVICMLLEKLPSKELAKRGK